MLSKYPKYEIVNLDKMTYASNPNSLDCEKRNPKYKFVRGDICNKNLVLKLVKNVDVIVHAAAESFVDKSIMGADDFVQTNVYGTYVLLEAARRFNIPFHYVGTDEVYGEIKQGKWDENAPIKPRNPYSATKAAGECLTMAYHNTYGLPVTITRSSNNYGPFQNGEKAIPRWIISAMRNEPLPVYGKGLQIRDWLFVSDNCKAVDLVIHKGKDGEIYNIGGNNEKRNIDVARMILKSMPESKSKIQFVKDRPGHDFRYALNSNKIRRFGWKPEVKFEDGLRFTIQWYKNNFEGWNVKRKN